MATTYRQSSITWAVITFLFVLLIGVNTYVARSTVLELSQLQSNIQNTGDVIMALDELHISLLTVESGQRGYLLLQQAQGLEHYRRALSRIDEYLLRARSLESDVSGQQALIAQTADLIDLMLIELKQSVDRAAQKDFRAVNEMLATGASVSLYSQINGLFNRIATAENDHRNALSTSLARVTAESRTSFAISLITSLLLVIGIFFLARLNINFQKQREHEIEVQNTALTLAVDERTQELSIYSDELKRSNRELEDFAFVASHDLQEPLRKIQTFGDRLLTQYSDNLGEKGKDYLTRMESAAVRMSQLISDLLDFSRITTRGKPFQMVDLNLLIEECLEDLSVKIDEKNARIRISKLPMIEADPSQMRQLFTNLLLNALKFSLPSTATKITITAAAIEQPEVIHLPDLEGWYKITVTDNGIGFEQDYAAKIFAPFQRLHSTKDYQGTGIGLSICRRIVERHNGEIHAVSALNEGAKFIVTLPSVNYLPQINDSEIEDE